MEKRHEQGPRIGRQAPGSPAGSSNWWLLVFIVQRWHSESAAAAAPTPTRCLDLAAAGLCKPARVHSTVGDDAGPKAFVQTSTGEILEIEQENLPIKNYRTGRSKWKEYIP